MIASLLAVLLLQSDAPVCAGIAPPPVGLEAWATISAITMGPVETGKTTGVRLSPSGKVVFTLPPERAPADGTFSGVYQFDIAKGGTYRIALEAGAWIDVVRNGKSLTSVAHMEGPRCSGIRKIVDFDLAPGAYRLQLSGAKAETMRVLIAPK